MYTSVIIDYEIALNLQRQCKKIIWENDSTEKLIKIILLRVIFLKFNRNKGGSFSICKSIKLILYYKTSHETFKLPQRNGE